MLQPLNLLPLVPCPANLWLLIFFIVPIVFFFFSEWRIIWIIQHVVIPTGFFHLLVCFQGFSMSFHGLVAHFFLLQNDISLHKNTVVLKTLFTHSGAFWLLLVLSDWIQLPWTFTFRFLCEHRFSNQLSKILGSTIARSYGKTMFSFVSYFQTVFPSTILHLYRWIRVPHQQLVLCLGFTHPSGCIVVSHCNLHFRNAKWCWEFSCAYFLW